MHQLLSPCAATVEAHGPTAYALQQESHHNVKPMNFKEQYPHLPQLEKAHAQQ